MNVREKFLATMEFDLSVPPPFWEMAYWIETVERWSKEGMTGFLGDDADSNRRLGKVNVEKLNRMIVTHFSGSGGK